MEGLICFLFKNSDLLEMGNYRTICLQDTAYKVLSAILTNSLYRLAARHWLLDPPQEGFRRLHSTQQVDLHSVAGGARGWGLSVPGGGRVMCCTWASPSSSSMVLKSDCLEST